MAFRSARLFTVGLLLAGCCLASAKKEKSMLKDKYVKVNGVRLHYVTAGKGSRTIVFIHGWACNLGFWREQISTLADKARLILIDLPGHGQSDKPQANYTMDFFVTCRIARNTGCSQCL